MSSIKEQFVIRYYPHAQKASERSGIPALFALAQSALESGWGKTIKGNMLFGVKKGSGKNYGGWQGHSQLITTTEYSSTATRRFPFIYPGYPILLPSGKWKYKIKDVFRAYASPMFSFLDWSGLLLRNSRYQSAMRYKNNPYQFAEAVARAGYATDPNYSKKVKALIREIEVIVKAKGLHKRKKRQQKIIAPMLIMGISVLVIVTAILKNKQKTE